MTDTAKKTEKRIPLHDFLVDEVVSMTEEKTPLLRRIFKEVIIPARHDEILSTLEKNHPLGKGMWFKEMKDSILAQKAEAEAKKAKLTDKDKFEALEKAIDLFTGEGFNDFLNQLHTVMCVIKTLSTKKELDEFLEKVKVGLKIKD